MRASWQIQGGAATAAGDPAPWMADFDAVVDQWQRGVAESQTSGSTGAPICHRFEPQSVAHSAEATAAHFGLHPTPSKPISAWSALPVSGTGGRMMLWRALILGWDLTVSEPTAAPQPPPTGTPDGRYDFGVATPMQARHLALTGMLSRFHQLLLGGAPLTAELEAQLIDAGRNAGCRMHLGFGMTETLTHIATRQLGTPEYQALPGVFLSQDGEGALVIHAPERGVIEHATRDAIAWATAPGGAFRWLGRLDAVINTGGVKVHPEALESEWAADLGPLLGARKWYAAGRPDATLGHHIAVVVEGERSPELAQAILLKLQSRGMRRPRSVEFVAVFRETATGKPIRH